MAIELRAQSTAPESNTLVIPSTTEVGDLIVLRASMYYTTACNLPADFTQAFAARMNGGNYSFIVVAYKIAVASDIGRSVSVEGYSPYPSYSTYSCHVFKDTAKDTPVLAVQGLGSAADTTLVRTGDSGGVVTLSGRVVLLFSAMMSALDSTTVANPSVDSWTRLYSSPRNSTNWHLGTTLIGNDTFGGGRALDWSATWPANGPTAGVALLLSDGPQGKSHGVSTAIGHLLGGVAELTSVSINGRSTAQASHQRLLLPTSPPVHLERDALMPVSAITRPDSTTRLGSAAGAIRGPW